MRYRFIRSIGLLLLLLSLAVSAVDALAQGRGFGPPPAAFTACEGIAMGAACSFTAPHGTVQGTCRNMREDPMVCVPGSRPGAMGPGGMREAGGAMMGQQGLSSLPGGGARGFGADIASSNPDAIMVSSSVPDTQQGSCFDNQGKIPCPEKDEPYFGQDASFIGAPPDLHDNGDGTVIDRVTGLMWQQAHHATRLGFYDAAQVCSRLDLGGHRDWRLPGIKELFSIADFRGSQGHRPYIDDVFDFDEPDASVLEGDRFASTHNTGMMGQTWSSTIYTGVHFGRPGVEAAFFFNFLDGHIKQAPTKGRNKLFYRCVRGSSWGDNDFSDQDNGTVEDVATGLIWQQKDDGQTYNWPQALAYCQNLNLAGKGDWRLPNVKELEGIVDYSRHAPALDEQHLKMSDPKGWFWSSTTHGDNIRHADYVCFGACTSVDGVDTHGAGAQRSDPKVGNPADYSSLGGQRDEVRIKNYVRCVRSRNF